MVVFWLQLASKHPRKRGGERRVERNAPKPPDQATRIHSDVATTTTCFQAPSSYNFRQQHARTFGYHLWLLDLPHSAQRRSSRCGLDVLTTASEQTSLGTSLLPGFPAIAQTTSHCLPLRVDMERPDLLFEDTGNQVRTPYHQRQPSPSGSLVGQIRRVPTRA